MNTQATRSGTFVPHHDLPQEKLPWNDSHVHRSVSHTSVVSQGTEDPSSTISYDNSAFVPSRSIGGTNAWQHHAHPCSDDVAAADGFNIWHGPQVYDPSSLQLHQLHQAGGPANSDLLYGLSDGSVCSSWDYVGINSDGAYDPNSAIATGQYGGVSYDATGVEALTFTDPSQMSYS